MDGREAGRQMLPPVGDYGVRFRILLVCNFRTNASIRSPSIFCIMYWYMFRYTTSSPAPLVHLNLFSLSLLPLSLSSPSIVPLFPSPLSLSLLPLLPLSPPPLSLPPLPPQGLQMSMVSRSLTTTAPSLS